MCTEELDHAEKRGKTRAGGRFFLLRSSEHLDQLMELSCIIPAELRMRWNESATITIEQTRPHFPSRNLSYVVEMVLLTSRR